MLKCTINGKEVEVEKGSTIIEAFMKSKQNIAHYCWHPGLSVAGVCRMCMVEIEGNPKLQIACNIPVTDGMVVNNKSEKVQESVEWVLGYHLINHPMDCPICDKAGECGLQEYYMQYGKYDPGMAEHKVTKRKVIDLGSKIVLDSERCILCTRCVRLTAEVSKTNELGIFNRGDRSELGTYEDRPLENDYALNTVDVCPVGALTSKDFRFKQRVWFLKDFETVCNGCSTGCNIKVYFNENGLYRVRPVHNKDVNGYWMCDEGRDLYKFVNHEVRQLEGQKNINGEMVEIHPSVLAGEVGNLLTAEKPEEIAVVLTGQYTTEEYEAFLPYFQKLGAVQFYHWMSESERKDEFDGILKRGDRNPNTNGLLKVFKDLGIKTKSWNQIFENIESKKIKTVVVAGPEVQRYSTDLETVFNQLNKTETLIWLTSCKNDLFNKAQFVIPMKSYTEKNGTFMNYKGLEQKIKKGVKIVPQALTLEDLVEAFSGKSFNEVDRVRSGVRL